MPPLPSQATWSPDVIATVVYRVTMVLVSLTYIWRKYRQPLRTDDLHKIVELLAVRTPTVEVKSDETPEPSLTNSVDSNNILQAVEALGAVAAMGLGITDCDGTSNTPSINVELQPVHNAYLDRRQGFNKSNKDG
ncbi:hypothetical protein BCIN_11g06210 [Botrytis cinerea B05.10]|uniref:Uncharacterized protein n=1 Tax=Botryotinia fuckeliana (strain B05.10) TaxID=332648 RepID=A0A384JXQ9_BOTFB|nr:hypothetical protein BCIN_11g06210 [Botrytis cinerea B05.10]ATZ55360.1 hypothetical protein BCIN_11g06210 [Botrytis cinerea B05.10]